MNDIFHISINKNIIYSNICIIIIFQVWFFYHFIFDLRYNYKIINTCNFIEKYIFLNNITVSKKISKLYKKCL